MNYHLTNGEFSKLNTFYSDYPDPFVCSSIGELKNCFVAADSMKRVHLWSIKKASPRLVLEGAQSDITCIKFNIDQTGVLCGT